MSMKLLMRMVLVFLSLSICARPAKLSVSFGPGRFGSSISRQPLIPLKIARCRSSIPTWRGITEAPLSLTPISLRGAVDIRFAFDAHHHLLSPAFNSCWLPHCTIMATLELLIAGSGELLLIHFQFSHTKERKKNKKKTSCLPFHCFFTSDPLEPRFHTVFCPYTTSPTLRIGSLAELLDGVFEKKTGTFSHNLKIFDKTMSPKKKLRSVRNPSNSEKAIARLQDNDRRRLRRRQSHTKLQVGLNEHKILHNFTSIQQAMAKLPSTTSQPKTEGKGVHKRLIR